MFVFWARKHEVQMRVSPRPWVSTCTEYTRICNTAYAPKIGTANDYQSMISYKSGVQSSLKRKTRDRGQWGHKL